MDIKRKENFLSGVEKSSDPRAQGLGDNGSQSMTLTQSNGELEWLGESVPLSTEYHLTIQITNSQLSLREMGLLLGVLNYQAVNYGVNLNMELALYELYFRILGNKKSSMEIRNAHLRLVITVTENILKFLKGSSFSGNSKEFIQLPPKVKEILARGLMSKRTYRSRYMTYRPERLLRIRIVPVDVQFLTRNRTTLKYSGYTKGYGESHPSAHFKRTKPSAELDGDDRTPEQVEELKLFERCTDPVHLLSEFLIIKLNNLD
jgi:hypothetical protein